MRAVPAGQCCTTTKMAEHPRPHSSGRAAASSECRHCNNYPGVMVNDFIHHGYSCHWHGQCTSAKALDILLKATQTKRNPPNCCSYPFGQPYLHNQNTIFTHPVKNNRRVVVAVGDATPTVTQWCNITDHHTDCLSRHWAM
jgi:hypothetical protein